MAATRGMGALGFAFVNPEAAEAWVNAYVQLLHEAPGKALRLSNESRDCGRFWIHVRADG